MQHVVFGLCLFVCLLVVADIRIKEWDMHKPKHNKIWRVHKWNITTVISKSIMPLFNPCSNGVFFSLNPCNDNKDNTILVTRECLWKHNWEQLAKRPISYCITYISWCSSRWHWKDLLDRATVGREYISFHEWQPLYICIYLQVCAEFLSRSYK